jgi:hypothetical protein
MNVTTSCCELDASLATGMSADVRLPPESAVAAVTTTADVDPAAMPDGVVSTDEGTRETPQQGVKRPAADMLADTSQPAAAAVDRCCWVFVVGGSASLPWCRLTCITEAPCTTSVPLLPWRCAGGRHAAAVACGSAWGRRPRWSARIVAPASAANTTRCVYWGGEGGGMPQLHCIHTSCCCHFACSLPCPAPLRCAGWCRRPPQAVEHWVQCDKCGRWRSLPEAMAAALAPDEPWECSMRAPGGRSGREGGL